MTRRTGSPPPSSSQHRDRRDEDLSLLDFETYGVTPSVERQLSTVGVLEIHVGFEGKSYITCTPSPEMKTLVKTRRVHRYWYSSP